MGHAADGQTPGMAERPKVMRQSPRRDHAIAVGCGGALFGAGFLALIALGSWAGLATRLSFELESAPKIIDERGRLCQRMWSVGRGCLGRGFQIHGGALEHRSEIRQ
jgi:hypothetical protein